MKIAIPSLSDSLESLISGSLGRAPCIIVYDSETKTSKSYENIGFTSQDGSGIKAAQTIIQNKVDVLLTMEIGQKAYSVLVKEDVDIHLLSSGGTVKSAINKFLKL